MKQKKINDILYVFDITPYQITEDTDAEVIKVQQEVVAGFKELNESIADKIVAYNYHVACVNTPEWAPYVDQDDPEPQKQSPELAWSAEEVTVINAGGVSHTFPTLSNPYNVEVTYSASNPEYATIDENGEITLVTAGDTWIEASFAGDDTYEAQTVSYLLHIQEEQVSTVHTITLTGTGLSAETVTIKNDGETVALAESYGVEENAWFEIYPLQDIANYTLVSENMQFENDPNNYHWYVSPQEDMTVELNYTEQV